MRLVQGLVNDHVGNIISLVAAACFLSKRHTVFLVIFLPVISRTDSLFCLAANYFTRSQTGSIVVLK